MIALPSFLRRKPVPTEPPSVGEDRRVYAIGDIHGRADLLESLLERIEADNAARDPVASQIVLLGDLVDRGPDSARVIEMAMALAAHGGHCLKGNHEELFVRAARGDARVMPHFRRMGGMATLASYGLEEGVSADMDDAALAGWMLAHIPRAHVDFADSLADFVEIGDYLFVHAGIRPGRPLTAQHPEDLRWIRAEFLTDRRPHSHMVVHGHSITPDVDERPNRIGIDTGAYASGRLTALGLQGSARWRLQTP